MVRVVGLVMSLGLLFGTGAAQASERFSLECMAGPIWASHWSPHEKPPGTRVEPSWREGLLVEVGGVWRWSRWLSGETGLSYAEKGALHTVEAAGFPFGEMELIYKFRYLEFPLLLRTYWIDGERFKLFSYGGGYLALELANRYTFRNQQSGTASHPLSQVEKTDFGFISGTGLEVHLGRFVISAKYRYSMGFVDLSLDTDPVYIPQFRGVDFPVIELRNLSHAALVGVRYIL